MLHTSSSPRSYAEQTLPDKALAGYPQVFTRGRLLTMDRTSRSPADKTPAGNTMLENSSVTFPRHDRGLSNQRSVWTRCHFCSTWFISIPCASSGISGDGSTETRAGSLLEPRITRTPSPGAPADR
jgi:hypothetical protein